MELIKKLLPLIVPFFLVCAFAKLHIYYNYFGIQISDYISYSEILLTFLGESLIGIILLFIGLVVNILITSKKQLHKNSDLFQEITQEDRKRSIWKILWEKNKEPLLLLIPYVVFLVVIIFITDEHKWLAFLTLSTPLLFIIISEFILQLLRFKFHILFGYKIKSQTMNVLKVMLIIAIINISSAPAQIATTLESKNIISFFYKSKKITTNSSLLYLGQTKEYLFLYDKTVNESFVFERDQIKGFSKKRPMDSDDTQKDD